MGAVLAKGSTGPPEDTGFWDWGKGCAKGSKLCVGRCPNVPSCGNPSLPGGGKNWFALESGNAGDEK